MAKVEYRKDFKVSQTTIHKTIKKLGIFYRKNRKVPKVTTSQLQRQKKRLSKLRRGALKPLDKLDDETYFTLSGMRLPGNVGYYTDKRSEVSENVKFYGQQKFPKRVMVWCVISPK